MKRISDKLGGFVLVIVAALLVVLIGVVALGVDTGALYSARTEAQSAADAAALAGAFTYIVKPTDPQPATAIAAAKAVAMNYTILGKPVTTGDIDVYADPATEAALVAARKVPVTVRTHQNTYFAKVLGFASADIEVHALAEAGTIASGPPPNPKPFFLPNTILSTMDPCDACMSSPASEVLIDPATGMATAWAKARYGAEMSIKPTDPSEALQPSLYFLIDFTGGGGGVPELSGWIDGSIPTPQVACGMELVVEKGNKVALKHGIDNLLGDPPDDDYVAVGKYAINGSVISDVSKALVTVPIWDTCGSGFCGTGIPKIGGHQRVAVLGWAIIFLDGGDDPLVGHLINVGGCAAGGGGTPVGSGSSVIGGFPLRLVR